jgi:hypothetical protein
LVGCASANGNPDAVAPAETGAADLAVDVVEAAADLVPDAPRPASLLTDRRQIDFGVFYLGCPRASSALTVANFAGDPTGDLLVTVDKPFKLGLDECSARTLLVGEQCQIEVRVAPEEAGELTGALRVWSTTADLVQVGLKVVATDAVPAFLLSPSSLDFTGVMVGQSATQKVMVSVPDGFRPVPKLMTTLIGSDFAIGKDGCAGVALQAGQMCEIEIAFHPTSAGNKSAALSLSAPEPCPPFQSQVTLTGKAE